MVSAIGSALSGLAAAGKRLSVGANNIANQFSTRSRIDGVTVNQPYTPQRVHQVSLENGGVQTVVTDVNPPTTRVFDPQHVDADADGTVAYPNVDIATELVNQKLASYDFKANLKTIKIEDDMQKSLLDILG
jgi:flagellar basal-body rod protein FlgC